MKRFGVMARPGATSTLAYEMPPYCVGSDFMSDRLYARSGPGSNGVMDIQHSNSPTLQYSIPIWRSKGGR
jgi:hypothetical protein